MTEAWNAESKKKLIEDASDRRAIADRELYERKRRLRAYDALLAEARDHEGGRWVIEFLESVK